MSGDEQPVSSSDTVKLTESFQMSMEGFKMSMESFKTSMTESVRATVSESIHSEVSNAITPHQEAQKEIIGDLSKTQV